MDGMNARYVPSHEEAERKHRRLKVLQLARNGYPSPACTEPVMCTPQPRYRLLKRASLGSMNWPLQLRERGSRVEPRRALLPFRPFRGWKGFFIVLSYVMEDYRLCQWK